MTPRSELRLVLKNGRKKMAKRHMSTLKRFVIALLDVAAVLAVLKTGAISYGRRRGVPCPPVDPTLDQINVRYFAYGGMTADDVGKVYPLPVQIFGDSAWVTVAKWPKGHTEVLMVRDCRGWKKGNAVQTTMYPEARP